MVGSMLIDCKSCQAVPAACDDCVVTVLLGPMGGIDRDEEDLDAIDRRAFDALIVGGLVSSLDGAIVTTGTPDGATPAAQAPGAGPGSWRSTA